MKSSSSCEDVDEVIVNHEVIALGVDDARRVLLNHVAEDAFGSEEVDNLVGEGVDV